VEEPLRKSGSHQTKRWEGTGFEPSVPRKAPCVALVSSRVRAGFSVREGSSRGGISPLETLVVSRGTDGSNPVPSSSESATNRTIQILA
jgi:hypothetical protein